jgi:uncharacterized protein
MRAVFADTSYWVAIANPGDRWHRKATALRQSLRGRRVITTEEVLGEVLTYFSGYGARMRQHAIRLIRMLESDPQVVIIPQSQDSFRAGVAFYADRPDKEYSLIDCISMATIRAHGLTGVLTNDHHFTQEGLVVLLRA